MVPRAGVGREADHMTHAALIESRSIRIPECGCRLWTGAITSEGYGHFMVRVDGKKKNIAAHRASWEIANGRPVPDGLCVLHRCDVRSCNEPTHLFLGTKLVNNQDRKAKGRNCDQRGERNHRARLTLAQVQRIRVDKRLSCVIAAECGVTPGYIRKIRRGERWAV